MADPGADDLEDRVLDLSIWEDVTERIGALVELVRDPRLPDSPQTRAEGLRYLTRFLSAGLAVCVAFDDADYPELGRMIENRMSWGLDNPDCLYSYTRLRGDRSYRISGDPGTACHLEIQVNTGHFGDGDFTGWQAVAARDRDSLARAPDGTVEVVLSSEEHPGDWMPLREDASFLLMRQYFDDWEAERPADLLIEPLDATYPPPPPDPATMGRHLDTLLTWLETGARCWADLGTGLAGGEPGPIQPFLPPDDAAGLKGQAYGMGAFACAPGEAVVLELDPPACRMWSLSLANGFWESMEFGARQSSLNGHQAVPDTDGIVRAVICQQDPGVANWLDPGGWERGTLAVRYLQPESVPPLAYRTVPLAQLDAALGPDTVRCTPTQRHEALARRRRALLRRYRR